MKLRWEDMVNRSTVTLASLVLLLGLLLAARALLPQQTAPVSQNVNPEQVQDAEDEFKPAADFFEDFRTQRKQAREDELALLDSIITREGAPEESVKEADASKIKITQIMEQERILEKLLIAKGFEDAAAFLMEDSLTVAVKKAELDQRDTAKILELALRCTGLDEKSVKIIPVSPE